MHGNRHAVQNRHGKLDGEIAGDSNRRPHRIAGMGTHVMLNLLRNTCSRFFKYGRSLASLHEVTKCLALVALPLALLAPSTEAACLHWGQEAPLQNPSESITYYGTLGNRYVRMRLHLDPATGRLDGAYGYNDEPGTLKLVGYMLKDHSGVELVELDKKDNRTGFFDLSFMPPTSFLGSGDPVTEGRAPFEKQWNTDEYDDCGSLVGVWMTSSRPGTSAKAVVLRSGQAFDPNKDRQARLQNEATAYAFMQAVIHNDRQKVVSLFHYPFHSYDQAPGRQGVRTWKTPEDVLKHYTEIVQLEPQFVRPLVPHMLFTQDGLSGFMNGSMSIYEGKIRWLCAGSCPIMSWGEAAGRANQL